MDDRGSSGASNAPAPPGAPESAWRRAARELGGVAILATADYANPTWTNKQHIASRLASVLPVIYVDSLGMRRPRLAVADLRRVARRAGSATAGRSQVPRGLSSSPHVISPIVVPWHGHRAVRYLNRRLLRLQLGRALDELPRPRILWTYQPVAIDEIDLDPFDAIVYHCVDDLASVPGCDAELVRRTERKLASRATVIFATTRKMGDLLRPYNAATHVIPNVADAELFSCALGPGLLPEDLSVIPAPRAMFIGSLSDHKIDWNLLAAAAGELRDWSFVFIGAQGNEADQSGWRPVGMLPNCYMLGHRAYGTLPGYLRGADVALVPYLRSPHTDAVCPMKIIEYLAAGRPVVSTSLPALLTDRSMPVAFADDPAAFCAAIRSSVVSPEAILRRSAYASTRTWDTLLDQMLALLLQTVRGSQDG